MKAGSEIFWEIFLEENNIYTYLYKKTGTISGLF
jgi:hypothetical protein